MSKILIIIAAEGYQDHEYGAPKAILEAAGHETITCSTAEKAFGKFGDSTDVDVLLKDAKSDDYDAVAFIGGPGSFQYFDDPKAHELAKSFYDSNKLTCAICAAPGTLANAGLLEGKTATCWEGEGDHLREKGANYTGADVEKDGNLITASGPPAAEEFGQAIMDALNQESERQ